MFARFKKFLMKPDFSPTSLLGWVRAFVVYIFLLIGIFLFLGLLEGGISLYDNYRIKSEAEQKKKEKDSIGMEASIAGMQLLSAYKSCVRIGINDLDRCSKYEGQLMQEISAPVLAKVAIDLRDGYYNKCLKYYHKDYCNNLLNRSISLSNSADQ